jgi:penicillin-binding protein 1C
VLLSATTSSEQQWCFPMDEDIPENLKKCIIIYEDEYFAFHPGINPVAIIKALAANVKSGKTLRGASTIPMQVMRMKNRNARRNVRNKIYETLSAIKYSLITSDKTILREWCEIAPFGGNTIGIKAASLRYFGRSVEKLSWAEYALLAVMPNGPSYANLTKNRHVLRQKRDFLLRKLNRKGYFDHSELELYLGEDLPGETKTLPQYAYHLLSYLKSKYPDKYIFRTTLPSGMQLRTYELLERESAFLRPDDIRNMAVVVIDIQKNKVLAYHGNAPDLSSSFSYVDVAQSPRSYGSLLKPLLYAYALEMAQFLPNEMIADIPTSIGDFQPENFDKKYRGAVPFEEMLIQSLNVPAVRVLNTVGLQGFYDIIRTLGIAYLDKGADYYGLSIILGGGESSLWDLSRIYKGLAQNYAGISDPFKPVQILLEKPEVTLKNKFAFSPATMDHVAKAMSDLTRPREEKSWQLYGTDYKIAWKTGTSYGHKDAWAMGFNGRYMVGVWIGNEGGEGRFDLTGLSKAAPVMFKIFNSLPENQWFAHPPAYSKQETITLCAESGKMAGPLCKIKKKFTTDKTSYKYQQCTYHQEVWLNKNGLSISPECKEQLVQKDTFFVLPSYMEYYYRQAHGEYRIVPEHDAACMPSGTACRIIYPQQGMKIFLPKENADKQNELIAKAYHRNREANLFWFIDNDFRIMTGKSPHDCMLNLLPGPHTLTVTDQWGNKDEVHFEIIARR